MRMRRVARTEKGYLGLVPDSVESGDTVWLLEGACVSHVLRKFKKGSGTDSVERWEVMGEACVHDIMEGQVWNDLELHKHDLFRIDLM